MICIRRFLDLLGKDLGRLLPTIIKDYFYCLGNHFEELEPHLSYTCLREGKRKVVREIFTQLELLARETDFMWGTEAFWTAAGTGANIRSTGPHEAGMRA
jgi:hypothetical protein